jgi:hypothetical protein
MSSTPDLQVLPDRTARRTSRDRAYCQSDHWAFDPRYTGGRCPLCGWVAPEAQTAPALIAALRRLEWDITGLFLLVIGAIVVGGLVAHAAGLLPALRLR